MQNTLISLVLRAMLSAGLSLTLQPQAAATVAKYHVARSYDGIQRNRCVVPNALPACSAGLE